MKIKARTKKILVLSVMVVLLVATGVLNWALNDKLTSNNNQPANAGTVTETFFAAYRSDREAARESEFLYLDAIIASESSSDSAKKEAEQQKLTLVDRIEKELHLEALIKAKGFDDAVITLNETGVNVVVGATELTDAQAAQILSIIKTETAFKPSQVKIFPYK